MKRLPRYNQQGRADIYSVSAPPLELCSHCSMASYIQPYQPAIHGAVSLEETRRLSVSHSIIQVSQSDDWRTCQCSVMNWRWASTSSSTQ